MNNVLTMWLWVALLVVTAGIGLGAYNLGYSQGRNADMQVIQAINCEHAWERVLQAKRDMSTTVDVGAGRPVYRGDVSRPILYPLSALVEDGVGADVWPNVWIAEHNRVVDEIAAAESQIATFCDTRN